MKDALGKKEILIFTLNAYSNYGNRLQLFALSTVIKNIGYGAKIYWPKSFTLRFKEAVKNLPLLRKKFIKPIKLQEFTKRYIPKETNNFNADYSIVGSDQVWNPNLFSTQNYLLKVPNNSVKISYAASMGVESLTEEQKNIFRKALKEYKCISVREKTAKDLLQPLTDKKIEVVLDPTLLLDKSVYEELEKRPKNLKAGEKYVLCYILGNRDYQNTIERYARDNNCKVIIFSDKKDSNYGVEEFLYLIHHAELICTDSFHACVFSFIFDRPFVAFRRSGEADYMYSRLQNLINTFHLKNREFNGKNITEENLKADYTEGKEILKKEQKKSIDFLKKALEMKDEG